MKRLKGGNSAADNYEKHLDSVTEPNVECIPCKVLVIHGAEIVSPDRGADGCEDVETEPDAELDLLGEAGVEGPEDTGRHNDKTEISKCVEGCSL